MITMTKRPEIAWADPLPCVSRGRRSHAVLLPEGWDALCGIDGYVLGTAGQGKSLPCAVCKAAEPTALEIAMRAWRQPELPLE